MAIDYIVTRFIQHNVGGLRTDLATLAADFTYLELHIAKTHAAAVRFAAIGTLGLAAVTTLFKESATAAGQVQRVQAGFETVLRSVTAANKLQREVRKFDIKTPFTYLETAKGAQMLLAAGFRDDLIPAMEAIGNATIAAGGGTEKFIHLLGVLSRIRVDNFLQTRRLHQFAASGINIIDILMQKLKLTKEQMANIGKLHLSADVVIPAIIEGLQERFAGGIEKAQHRYLGAVENMKAQGEVLLTNIGVAWEDTTLKMVQSITKMLEVASDFAEKNPAFIRQAMSTAAIVSGTSAIIGAFKVYRLAAGAKDMLTAATVRDTIAERTKAGVATAEAAAIGSVGRNARSTRAAVLAMSGAQGAKYAGASGVGPMAAVGRTYGAGAPPAVPTAAIAASQLSWMRQSSGIQNPIRRLVLASSLQKVREARQDIRELETGLYFVRKTIASSKAGAHAIILSNKGAAYGGRAYGEAMFAHEAEAEILRIQASRKALIARELRVLETGGTGIRSLGEAGSLGLDRKLGMLTKGGVAMSGLAALGSGYSAYSDLGQAGWKPNQAAMYGVATTIGTAIAALFIPGGAIAIAFADGIRGVVNYAMKDTYKIADEGLGATVDPGSDARGPAAFKAAAKATRDSIEAKRAKAQEIIDRAVHAYGPKDPRTAKHRQRAQKLLDEANADEAFYRIQMKAANASAKDEVADTRMAKEAAARKAAEIQRRRQRLLEDRTFGEGYYRKDKYSASVTEDAVLHDGGRNVTFSVGFKPSKAHEDMVRRHNATLSPMPE